MYARERARHEHAFLALREVLSGCTAAGIDVLAEPVAATLAGRLRANVWRVGCTEGDTVQVGGARVRNSR